MKLSDVLGYFFLLSTCTVNLLINWLSHNSFCIFYVLAIPAHLSFSRPLLTEALFWGLYIFSRLNSNILFKEEILPRYKGRVLLYIIQDNSRQFVLLLHKTSGHQPRTKSCDEPHVEMLCLQSGVFTQPKFEGYPSASSHFRSHRRVFGLHSRSAGKQFASTNRASYLFTVGTEGDW